VHTATNKLQERGGAIQEGKVHNSEERIKELEAPISRLDNDVKENCEQKELHGEHHPPVSIILEVEPLVTSCQGRMQLRFQVLGALVDFKYRIVVQHMDVVLLQWCQNSRFKARNYVDLYCESDWDYVNDDSRRRDTACVRAV
jgi:hypothetical protein